MLSEDRRPPGQRQRTLFLWGKAVARAPGSCMPAPHVSQVQWGLRKGPGLDAAQAGVSVTGEEHLGGSHGYSNGSKLAFCPRGEATSSFKVAGCTHNSERWPR